MCLAVASEDVPQSLVDRKPGTLSHSRWITLANRILRVYVTTTKPSQNLKVIVEYVIKVYAPTLFEIKRYPSCVNGPIHLFQLIKRSRFLPPEIRRHVDVVLGNNAYFAHLENLLLAMINDDRPFIRELAWFRILQTKQTNTNDSIRPFRLPKLNFNALDYIEMIDWDVTPITPPPLLRRIEINMNTIRPLLIKKLECHEFGSLIVGIPNNTQAVERTVKLVTQSANRVCGQSQRDGFILSTLQSRSDMSRFLSKKDYSIKTKANTKHSV